MGIDEVDLTGDGYYSAPSRKRKAKNISKNQSSAFASSSASGRKVSQAIDLTGDDDDDQYAMPSQSENSKRKRKTRDVDEDVTFEKAKPAVKKGKMKAGDNESERRLKKYALITHCEAPPIDVFKGIVLPCLEQSPRSWRGLPPRGMSLL